MSVFTRHPRYCMLLACVLLGAFFMLSTPGMPAESLRPGSSLRKILQDEDRRYDQALRARQALVGKWGPTDDDVVS